MDFRNRIKEYAEAPISRHLLLALLSDYQRPNNKISELLKRKELILIKRGLYITGQEMDLRTPEPFLIANYLRGPSYVSLESALSYWSMIPQRVYEISSATIKTSKLYKTSAGRFSYRKLPIPYYSFGIKNIEHSPKQTMLVASPEKALCDKIVLTPKVYLRSMKQAREFLIRKWKNRVKGRDWYDLEWNIKKGIPSDVQHFLTRAIDSNDCQGDDISNEQIIELLDTKINLVFFRSIKQDVIWFIKNDNALDIWGPEYFRDLIERIKFENT